VRGVRRRVLVSLAMVGLGGCGFPGGDQTCTLVLPAYGASLDPSTYVAAHPTAASVRACVERECRTVRRTDHASVPWPRVRPFGGETIRSGRSYDMQVTVSDARNRLLVSAHGSFLAHRNQPNGPRCDPSEPGAGGMRLTASGELVDSTPHG
jgi:hypothetical protein